VKLGRFGADRIGVVEGEHVIDVSAALAALPPLAWPQPPGDALVARLDEVLAAARRLQATGRRHRLDEVQWRSPIANPSKIVGAPVNYQRHLAESRGDRGIHHGSDVKTIDVCGLFLKAASSLVGAAEGVALRFPERRNDHEVELVAVIGKAADRVSRAQALDHVAGYAIGLDMTVRGTEDRSFRKSIDSYTVLGPWLTTADEVGDPGNLDLKLYVNSRLRQESNTRYLIYDVARLIEYASSFYTLYPGDLLMTGTPEGVGPVQPGDRIVAEIAGLGELRVDVRSA
jgi:2-keto-4-pentenoate hydratase/2-oxohepta-3-ene-1,7-dioic acid hydratase in catechol pathway